MNINIVTSIAYLALYAELPSGDWEHNNTAIFFI